jgi:ornithine carbamoyltransferase
MADPSQGRMGCHAAMNMPQSLLENSAALLGKISPSDVQAVLVSARRISQVGAQGRPLQGRHVAMLCETPRSASSKVFVAAAQGLGARVVRIRPSTAQLGNPNSMQDTTRLLGRLYCALGCDGIQPSVLVQVMRWASVPVFDAVSADTHPTRLLADLLTMCSDASKPPNEITLYVISDARSALAIAWRQVAKLTGLGVRTNDSQPQHVDDAVSDFVYQPQGPRQSGELLSLASVANGKRVPRSLLAKQAKNHVCVVQALLVDAVN